MLFLWFEDLNAIDIGLLLVGVGVPDAYGGVPTGRCKSSTILKGSQSIHVLGMARQRLMFDIEEGTANIIPFCSCALWRLSYLVLLELPENYVPVVIVASGHSVLIKQIAY